MEQSTFRHEAPAGYTGGSPALSLGLPSNAVAPRSKIDVLINEVANTLNPRGFFDGRLPTEHAYLDTSSTLEGAGRDRTLDRLRMENGAIVAPNLLQPNGRDLTTSVLEVPELSQRKNTLSIYNDERSYLVDSTAGPSSQPQAPPNQTLLMMKAEVDALRQHTQELERELARYKGMQGEHLKKADSSTEELQRERSERYRWMQEAERLKRENESLQWTTSRLEADRAALSKALSDVKTQRDQVGTQRMQVVAIRNFLLALELERIRLLYLEKENECAGIKNQLVLAQHQPRAEPVVQRVLQVVDRSSDNTPALLRYFLLAVETQRLGLLFNESEQKNEEQTACIAEMKALLEAGRLDK